MYSYLLYLNKIDNDSSINENVSKIQMSHTLSALTFVIKIFRKILTILIDDSFQLWP